MNWKDKFPSDNRAYEDDAGILFLGDVLEVLKTLPDESVDTIITSPPYWGLRDYGVEGQIGLEPTLEEYLEKLLKITAELKRVLKKTGIMFWNHGDSYGSHRSGQSEKITAWREGKVKEQKIIKKYEKSLLLQNYRLILRMIDEQGWVLRNVIIWHKPNHMPSSVKDRFTNAYEPVFMLVKSKKYWFDLDAVRVLSKTGNGASQGVVKGKRFGGYSQATAPVSGFWKRELKNHLLGKNPGDLWTIPTQPFPEAHFATFSEKLIEPMIKAGCPAEICKKCGKARERITEVKYDRELTDEEKRANENEMKKRYGNQYGGTWGLFRRIIDYKTIGWTDCGCNAGFEPGVVLDPFMGSGTTAVVALKLGKRYIGIELNPEYIEIAKKRIEKVSGRLFNAP